MDDPPASPSGGTGPAFEGGGSGPGGASSGSGHPERIGPYRIVSVLGEGGMGVVYLAEQTEPVRREVALKILKPGMDTRQVMARFETERQSLAVMEHPGIARVFDAGATEQGRPYFVMERVDGEPITEYCDRRRLGLRARARLFVQVCRAVQHAHQKGVIHRDLKPSNVLAGEVDGEASCKVIDFGVARAVERVAGGVPLTQVEQYVGTPAYMSPEQVADTGLDIDTRTDVYSLGVLLYELLAGELPFKESAYRGVALLATHAVGDPPPPSSRFAGLPREEQESVAERRGGTPDAILRGLRGDLDWIAMCALEKERERRYGTVADLAADLDRHLDDRPVVAGPPSRAYAARKFIRRHRVGVVSVATLAVLLVLFAGAMAVQADRVATARDLAVARQAQAEGLISFMLGDLRGQLAPVGRLDILDEVAQRALVYFAAVPEGELTEEEILRRAEAVRQLGEVRLEQGNLEPAMEAFLQAQELARTLARRDPLNGEWQLELAHSHFWVGYVHWLGSELDRALEEFRENQRVMQELVRLDPGNDDWQAELGNAYSNVGSVLEAQGALDEALEPFREVRDHARLLAARDPANRDRRFHVAVHENKVAVVLQKLGRLDEATEGFRTELAIKDSLVVEQPDDIPMLEHLAIAHAFVGRGLMDQGAVTDALGEFEAALELFRTLVAHDPANQEWQAGLGSRLLDLGGARLHAPGPTPALPLFEEAVGTFEALLEAEPSAPRPQRGLAASRQAVGRYWLAQGDFRTALTELTASRRILETRLGDAPGDRRARLDLAQTLVLQGDAFGANGRTADAASAWQAAREQVEPFTEGSPELDLRGLWAAVLLRTGEAQAAEAVLQPMDRLGYREPGFVQLVGDRASAR
jgi:eukaryotic-like serine/threonine-protein kinase